MVICHSEHAAHTAAHAALAADLTDLNWEELGWEDLINKESDGFFDESLSEEPLDESL